MNVVVGSQNPVKQAATEAVLRDVYPQVRVSAQASASGVAAQPWGDDETRQGAYNRAQFILSQTTCDLAVGLEGGVINTPWGLMTCAWCALCHRDGTVGVGGGSHMLLPPQVAQQLHAGAELGLAMDQLLNAHNTKQSSGAIGILTDGLLTRQSAYEVILRLALAPFRQPKYYRGSV